MAAAREGGLPPPPPAVPLVPACATLFPTDRTLSPSPHRVGVVFYRDAANYHCKRPVPVKVERMGFRYDFQKREKAAERQRKRTKRWKGGGRRL